MSQTDRLTPEEEAKIEEWAWQLHEWEGEYHYPSGLLANGSRALLKLLEECRTLRAERDEPGTVATHKQCRCSLSETDASDRSRSLRPEE